MNCLRQLGVYILVACCWHPGLTWEPDWSQLLDHDAAAELDAIADLQDCRLSEDTASAIERLLLQQHSALTVQSEAVHALKIYVRCVDAGRATKFVGERMKDPSPSLRAELVRSLATMRHPVAAQLLVDALDDNEAYAFTGAPENPDQVFLVSDVALRSLQELFPAALSADTAHDKDRWREWWQRVGPDYPTDN